MIFPSKNIEDITKFLFIGQNIEELAPADLVIVLGNNIADDTIATLYRLFKADKISPRAKIIFSGATGSLNAGEENECDLFYRLATEKYMIAPEMCIKENKAKNAFENFSYSKIIIENLGGFDNFQHICVLGHAFLLRRASMYAAKLDYPTTKMEYFGVIDREGRNIAPDCWWSSDISRERVLAEIKRIGEYALKGDLSIF